MFNFRCFNNCILLFIIKTIPILCIVLDSIYATRFNNCILFFYYYDSLCTVYIVLDSMHVTMFNI